MSLHTLANHMAAQGRNNDSMLVHMTPREVNGLHALALANGGNLTINPETGLPEAGFLEDLLPAIIGFGLDTFVPGLGEAVGGALGLSGAAGTGIAVGGLTGLATGSLSKGVMAGFGAYGGAGLADSFMGAGASSIQNAAEVASSPGSAHGAFIPAEGVRGTALANASPMDRLTAGFSATTQNPSTMMDFTKNNAKNFFAAGAPLLAGGFSTQDQTVTKMPDDRMITPFVMNQKSVPRNESLSPSAQQRHITYGVTPITPVHAASGGAVSTFDDYDEYGYLKGSDAARRATPVWNKFTEPPPNDGVGTPLPPAPPGGGGGSFGREPGNTYGSSPGGVTDTDGYGDGMRASHTDDYTQLLLNAAAPRTFKNTMTGDSAKAFDYLMGYTPDTAKATRVAQVRAPGVAPVAPTDPTKTTTDQREVGGGPGSPAERADARGSATADTGGLRNIGLSLANSGIPGLTTVGDKMLSFAEKENAALANNTVTDPAQRAANAAIGDGLGNPTSSFGGVQAPGEMGRGVMSGPTAANPMGSDPAQGQGQPASTGGTNAGVGRTPGEAHDGQGEGGGGLGEGSGAGRYGAQGGYLNNGQFDQRYAYGGGIAALSDGGLGSLGGYSDGGRLLRGPGDGVSDSIPATIGNHQPARLADGEFVVPARIVSELGNGSTEAGARQLYAMMDRIQKGRRKTVGKNKVAANTRAAKHLPA